MNFHSNENDLPILNWPQDFRGEIVKICLLIMAPVLGVIGVALVGAVLLLGHFLGDPGRTPPPVAEGHRSEREDRDPPRFLPIYPEEPRQAPSGPEEVVPRPRRAPAAESHVRQAPPSITPSTPPLFTAGDPWPRLNGFRGWEIGSRLSELRRAYPQAKSRSGFMGVDLDGDGTFSRAVFYYEDGQYDPTVEWVNFWVKGSRAEEVRREALAAFGQPQRVESLGALMEWSIGGHRVVLRDEMYQIHRKAE